MKRTSPGSLTVVGTGIQLGHLSLDARAAIEDAEHVLYLVADAVTKSWILEVQPQAESLDDCYEFGKVRLETYNEMVERILVRVRQGLEVCAAFYGHPGVFVRPSHEAIRLARQEGYGARMLPGISAEDCLFADLGIDPGRSGCRGFEATHFLMYRCKADITCPLILWQIGAVGIMTFEMKANYSGLRVLVNKLAREYGAGHEVVVYEAASYPIANPLIMRVPLARVPELEITLGSTLFVPPKRRRQRSTQVMRRLVLSAKLVGRRLTMAGDR
jgi:uncharacterized protein YabN with tetrapyrrole methylase and pyrophosphatase domain